MSSLKLNPHDFDICDSENGYQRCPGCGIDHMMALVTNYDKLAVQCLECHHRGPEIEVPQTDQWATWPVSWQERDRLAFEA